MSEMSVGVHIGVQAEQSDVQIDVQGLNAFYGPAQALFGISLRVT